MIVVVVGYYRNVGMVAVAVAKSQKPISSLFIRSMLAEEWKNPYSIQQEGVS